jgi:hypothetical protein
MVIGLRDNNGIVDKLTPLNISEIEQGTVNFRFDSLVIDHIDIYF